MPIQGQGWEMHILRTQVQTNPISGRIRTVGQYQVFHQSTAQNGPGMSGMVAESKGPGKNEPAGNGRRVEAGRYPLFTQRGERYLTWGYLNSDNKDEHPQPGFELKNTGDRTEILVHPGHDFLASIGCINPCTSLPNAQEMIDFVPSRDRVIALIEDMKRFIIAFPTHNGLHIPGAFVVIDGEP